MHFFKLLCSIFVFVFYISADEIRLYHGGSVEGIVKHDDGDAVVIETYLGEMAIPYDDIDSIVFTGFQYNEELRRNWKIRESKNEKDREQRRKNRVRKSIKKKSNDRIKIYVTEWCGYCTRLENMLLAGKYKFERCDIEKSNECLLEFNKIGNGGNGVPLTVIGDNVIRGYDPEKFAALLK